MKISTNMKKQTSIKSVLIKFKENLTLSTTFKVKNQQKESTIQAFQSKKMSSLSNTMIKLMLMSNIKHFKEILEI